MKKARKKSENNKKMHAAVFILVILIIISIINIHFNSGIIEKKKFYAKIIVSGEYYGIDLNSSALTFGAVMPGGSASRNIVIENKYSCDIKIETYATGNIKDFIIVSENNFVLGKDEAKTVSFIVGVPKDAAFGTYDGEIYIVIKR
jgi:hypothetical protein